LICLAANWSVGLELTQATLFVRIMEYTEMHCRKPHLDANRIGAEDISLGDWIRTRRLEGVHRLAIIARHEVCRMAYRQL
jgi:hypothetical protein